MAPSENPTTAASKESFPRHQFLTLYFPAFVFALGYSIATPAIPVFAKSFDTGFGVASLVIVVHALGGLLAVWSIRIPFVAHGALALLAILPSFFLVRETLPAAGGNSKKDQEPSLSTRALLTLMGDRRYRGFLCAQFFASMTRGVLWGGTLLLYATFAYDVGAQGLGGLATLSTVVGIPITLSCGYLMDRFGRKTTMVPGFAFMALGLFYPAASAAWQWGLALFVAGFLVLHAGHAVSAGRRRDGPCRHPSRQRSRLKISACFHNIACGMPQSEWASAATRKRIVFDGRNMRRVCRTKKI